MSCGCGCGSDPCKYFTSLTKEQWKGSLARQLVGINDCVRDLKTQLGFRPYIVTIIRTRWSGGRRGIGSLELVAAFQVLPTPKVADLTSLSEIVQSVGRDEQGSVMVTEISGRYTEDQLRGYDMNGTPLGPDEHVFWEIEFIAGGDKRRFVPSKPPAYISATAQWTITLEKAIEDRARDGTLR